jgi:hypothetical protein
MRGMYGNSVAGSGGPGWDLPLRLLTWRLRIEHWRQRRGH